MSWCHTRLASLLASSLAFELLYESSAVFAARDSRAACNRCTLQRLVRRVALAFLAYPVRTYFQEQIFRGVMNSSVGQRRTRMPDLSMTEALPGSVALTQTAVAI